MADERHLELKEGSYLAFAYSSDMKFNQGEISAKGICFVYVLPFIAGPAHHFSCTPVKDIHDFLLFPHLLSRLSKQKQNIGIAFQAAAAASWCKLLFSFLVKFSSQEL